MQHKISNNMDAKGVVEQLYQGLADAGFKSVIISVEHVAEIQQDLTRLLEQGSLHKDFYDEIVSRYGLHWHFELPADFQEAKSIVITAIQQPKVSIRFRFSGSLYDVIIPPTYMHDTDAKAFDILSRYSKEKGYNVRDALLPDKLLAVHSGLARYGRNNIAYIDGWGSYFRLRVYFSDIPCTTDDWYEVRMMELCEKCEACVKNCPPGAISKDRFLIRGEKCITFHNEGAEKFPEWLDPAWHNCMIGCMICQDVCPANKEFTNWVVPGDEFTEDETEMILNGIPQERLPKETVAKLENLELIGDYDLLCRNLGVLVNQR